MMGKLAKVIRLATTVAVGGISGCTREMAAFTYCNVWNISTFQSKKRSISAEPRLVMERTCCIPVMLLTASSTGLERVTLILSIGIITLSRELILTGLWNVSKMDTRR